VYIDTAAAAAVVAVGVNMGVFERYRLRKLPRSAILGVIFCPISSTHVLSTLVLAPQTQQ
jgi:hypothetical protein